MLNNNVSLVTDYFTVVSCVAPPTITNGSPGAPTRTTFGGTVTYTCTVGYKVSPGVTTGDATCGANGQWANVPTCTSKC